MLFRTHSFNPFVYSIPCTYELSKSLYLNHSTKPLGLKTWWIFSRMYLILHLINVFTDSYISNLLNKPVQNNASENSSLKMSYQKMWWEVSIIFGLRRAFPAPLQNAALPAFMGFWSQVTEALVCLGFKLCFRHYCERSLMKCQSNCWLADKTRETFYRTSRQSTQLQKAGGH